MVLAAVGWVWVLIIVLILVLIFGGIGFGRR